MVNRFTKVVIASVFVMSFATAGGRQSKSDFQVGYVDLYEVMQAPVVKKKLDDLRQEFEARYKDLESARERLSQMREEMNKEAAAMTEIVKESREAEFAEMWNKFQQQSMGMQTEYSEKAKKIQEDCFDKIKSASKKLAKKQGLHAVFDKQALLFIESEANLTEDVIRQLK